MGRPMSRCPLVVSVTSLNGCCAIPATNGMSPNSTLTNTTGAIVATANTAHTYVMGATCERVVLLGKTTSTENLNPREKGRLE